MTTETPTRRKRRIAADEAHSWARNLRLGNHHAKSVLVALTLYVEGDGWCFVSIDQIADDIELSCDTVRRRLAWLEGIGAIMRMPQWIDENGVRNGDGRGKRTTDKIKLLNEADIDQIEARAKGRAAHEEEHPETIASSPRSEPGLNPVSPPVALGQPLQCGEGLTSEPEPEDSPQAPPSGGVPEKISAEEEARWQQFKIGYPDGLTDLITSVAEFRKLTQPQQDQAIAAEPIYAARCRRRNEKPMKAHLFLRKRTFEGLLAAPPETPSLAGPYAPDSEAGKALLVLTRIARRTLPHTRDNWLIYLHPITPQLLALAKAPRETVTYQVGTQNFGAWMEFFRAHLTNPPALHAVEAPWPYPPSKEGKIYTSSTGPPKESLMTQEDEEHLERTGTL